MNHISGKIEQLLALQKTLCKEYEKENKVLLETIEAQKLLYTDSIFPLWEMSKKFLFYCD